VSGSIELRRHRPFFEAWTIWGAFSPVAFDEARAELTWRNSAGNIGADVRGAWRAYGETNAGLESTPLKTGRMASRGRRRVAAKESLAAPRGLRRGHRIRRFAE
jgi:hypothetical protein